MSSGGMSSALGKLDPLGNKITQWGGDPLNLYGNQNNPYAALFPSGTPASAAAITLPAPNGSITPITYNPNSFVQRQPAGSGAYTAMAAQLAGPAYMPQIQNLPAVVRNRGTNDAAGTAPAGTTLAQLLAQVRGERTPPMSYDPRMSPMVYVK